ncbi:SusC/RagA family TonB-linked outer membrane protein [Marinifilum sp.]|uniref:SusC/RagA family TonB-linked outer membrane protein n=1 Tax=Marinifilum sp. TaxID=2033137 RepID=UPI003BAC6AB0
MKKNLTLFYPLGDKEKNRQWLMRLAVLKMILLMSLITTYASVNSQMIISNLKLQEVKLSEALEKVEELSNYDFVFSFDDVEGYKVSVDLQSVTLEECLNTLLKDLPLEYTTEDDLVIVSYIEPITVPVDGQQQKSIKGKVTDKEGEPLPGVSVIIKGSYSGTITDIDGIFKISVEEGTTLVFSFVGMNTKEVVYTGQTGLNVTMESSMETVEEVVVTGIVQRRAESFTGTASTYKAEEIRSVGTDNIIKSLSVLDPSFNIMENNELGSNPNALPEIRLRGEAVFSTPGVESIGRVNLAGDPNLPIFMLDDFQTTLEKVFDLDINRVESVTFLKDAAATAIYGSRAANGVVVIKTKQPESGELKVSYNVSGDFNFPDLRTYNLLNAEELFEVQNELGIWNYINAKRWSSNEINNLVQKGVDTDWISQPLRNAVGQKHSLNLMGGDDRMRYMLDVNYQDRPGVMKKSSRKNQGIALTLSYNASDKLIFRNRLAVDKTISEESPYGSFGVYSRMQPYFPVHDENGNVIERYTYYDGFDKVTRNFRNDYNPIFEAGIGNIDESKYTDINNNFGLEWRISPSFTLRSNLSYTYNTGKTEWFRSPQSYYYWEGYDIDEKGEYEYNHSTTERYYANTSLSFMKDFNGHFVNASIAFNATEDTYRTLGFKAQGFAAKNQADPAYAAGHGDGNLPVSLEGRNRLAGVLGLFGYSYKERYIADFTYRMDGSSQFGSKDKTAGFFSTGIGWNIHNEKFLKGNDVINHLRLKATYGQTGSTNFSSYQAKDAVTYYTDKRYLRALGTHLIALGNENLKWQTTESTDLGIEFKLFNNNFSATANYYVKKTVDMVIPVTTPPSLGFDSFSENIGEMENKGFELALRANLINKNGMRWTIHANGAQSRTKILAISNSLEAYNQISDRGGLSVDDAISDTSGDRQKMLSHQFRIRYQEGTPKNAIWAVRSLGIDPMTGQEAFLDKDGNTTFVWDPTDKVIVGNKDPDLRGTFGTTFEYGNFDVDVRFGYEFGGQRYNYTLVSKIENSDKRWNVDRRVLEETWKQPGDVVKFKSNYNTEYGFRDETTPLSSRFVEDFNLLTLSSVNINYNVPKKYFKGLGMESLRLTANMGDLFYWSTVRRERGFDYPYARSFTVSLRANF